MPAPRPKRRSSASWLCSSVVRPAAWATTRSGTEGGSAPTVPTIAAVASLLKLPWLWPPPVASLKVVASASASGLLITLNTRASWRKRARGPGRSTAWPKSQTSAHRCRRRCRPSRSRCRRSCSWRPRPSRARASAAGSRRAGRMGAAITVRPARGGRGQRARRARGRGPETVSGRGCNVRAIRAAFARWALVARARRRGRGSARSGWRARPCCRTRRSHSEIAPALRPPQ